MQCSAVRQGAAWQSAAEQGAAWQGSAGYGTVRYSMDIILVLVSLIALGVAYLWAGRQL